jgi:hypothetical protein
MGLAQGLDREQREGAKQDKGRCSEVQVRVTMRQSKE